MVSLDTQGGDMVNCLTAWDNVLVSGGDDGQLLIRFLHSIFLLKSNYFHFVQEYDKWGGGYQPDRPPGRMWNLRSCRLHHRPLVRLF